MSIKKQTELQYQRKINGVLVYIQNNLDNTLSLDRLSSIAHISKYHFHRVFSATTGESVLQYIKRVRLDNAALQLCYSTNSSITDIALDSGYCSTSAFTKSFKKRFSCNPREYRKNRERLLIDDYGDSKDDSWDGDVELDYDIIDSKEYWVLYVRKTGEYKIAAQQAWETLNNYIKYIEPLTDDSKHIGITYDSPKITSNEHIRYDACISCDTQITPTCDMKEVNTQTIPSGKFAVFTHRGDYQKLWETYNSIYSHWLFNTKYELSNRPSYSIYCSNRNRDEQNIQIYIPIKSKKQGN